MRESKGSMLGGSGWYFGGRRSFVRSDANGKVLFFNIRPRTDRLTCGIHGNKRRSLGVFQPGDLEIIPRHEHQLVLIRMMHGFGVRRTSLLTEPAPVALAEINGIVLDDFLACLVADGFQGDAVGRTGPHTQVAGDALVNMEGEHPS